MGNPGKRYVDTLHNAGFMTIDALAADVGCSLRRSLRFGVRAGKAVWRGTPVLLVEPQKFMNNSGTPVAAVLRYHRLGCEDLIVVLDDADLPLGRLRIRPKGGSGGHRGLESIIRGVGSEEFARVRIGIGRGEGQGDLVGRVLSPMSRQSKACMREAAVKAAEAVLCSIDSGVGEAMNRYNGVRTEPDDSFTDREATS